MPEAPHNSNVMQQNSLIRGNLSPIMDMAIPSQAEALASGVCRGYTGVTSKEVKRESKPIRKYGDYVLVQTDFSTELLRRIYETNAVVSRVRRIPISGNANGLKMNAIAESSRANGSRWGGILAYWLSEAGTKTASAPKFRQIELSLKKLIGLAYCSDELLEDATALEAVVREGFNEEIGFRLQDSIINGTGAGMPLGIMTSGALVSVTRNTAAHVYAEDIIGMWSRLYAPSRPNSVWFINQDVEPELHKMSLETKTPIGGALVYMPPGGLSQAPYGTLMGRPVIPIEVCQTMGKRVAPHICEDMMNNSQIQGKLNYANA